MKVSLRLFLILLFCSFGYINAQETTDNQILDTLYTDSIKNGRFTIDYTQKTKNLVKKSVDENCRREQAAKNQKTVITEKDINKVPLADKCIITPKIMGYKIQIFYTKDREKAQKIQSEFDAKFPNLSSEIKYLQPDFKVLVGDYLTKNSAGKDFNRLKRVYPGSFIIQFPVRCRTAH